jgi:hypothetical protein
VLDVYERFERHVKEDPETGCHNWTGIPDKDGYGFFNITAQTKEYAHRAAYKLYVGEIPKGLYILHRCDNPACVNPDHLFPGTQLTNMRDMLSKGRYDQTGENNPSVKLDWEKVRRIRYLYALGAEPQFALANMYDISRTEICDIVHNRVWKEQCL